MEAYEAYLNAKTTLSAPWYVVPADDKENVQLIISQVIVDTFEDLKMKYPGADKSRRDELQSIRNLLSSSYALFSFYALCEQRN